MVLGLASSGVHSNGFSLVRKLLLEDQGFRLNQPVNELFGDESYGDRDGDSLLADLADSESGTTSASVQLPTRRAAATSSAQLSEFPASLQPHPDSFTLGDVLIEPTRIYVKSILAMLEQVKIKGMAHITGGGFLENIPRVLPENVAVEIEFGSWPIQPVFKLMQGKGNVSYADMFRTFNMGIGMVVIVAPEDVGVAERIAREYGEQVYRIGHVIEGDKTVTFTGVTL
ncbi:MAG: hypothetical protein K6T85_01040 [Gorillibacterium sp.]|nr:hypothetical protein [Gorillibacterium sp.]